MTELYPEPSPPPKEASRPLGEGLGNGGRYPGNMRVVDLFCGAGGLSEGLRRAGLRITAGVDRNPHHLATFRENFPEAEAIAGEVSEVSLPAADIVVGGLPCQPFSKANYSPQRGDERRELWRSFAEAVSRIGPKIWMAENVPAFLRSPQWPRMRAAMEAKGWRTEYFRLSASRYGAAQLRERVFIFGYRRKPPPYPLSLNPPPRLGDVIFPPEPLREEPPFPAYLSPKDLHFDVTFPLARIRLRHIPPGGDHRDLPEYLRRPSWEGKPRQFWGRLRWDGLSSAVVANLHPAGHGLYFHPTEPRYLTLYERSLIQTFPPEWRWYGQGRRQLAESIGNAVPPVVGHHLGRSLRGALEG